MRYNTHPWDINRLESSFDIRILIFDMTDHTSV